MVDSYKTLESPAEGIFRDKGSRFLAFGFPVKTGTEIRNILAGLKKKYHDARHHCYAYRLGPEGENYRTNDDGEPAGTAGKPIYGQLLSGNLTNVLVVVVRYFGGTLLGTGGLVVAYRSATADMLSNAMIVDKPVEVELQLIFPYDSLNSVMRIIKEDSAIPSGSEYNTMCRMIVKVRLSSLDQFARKVGMIRGLHYETLQRDD